MTRPPRTVLVATVLAATLAGCSSAGSTSGTGPQPVTANPALVAAAHLPVCPASATTPVPGGLPNLTLACLGHGPAVHLAGLTGKPTVVNLWGSWCGPCQQEAALLSSVYDRDRAAVRFLGVDIEDSPNSALSFGTHVTPPVRYPSVVDPEKKLLISLHFQGPPETALLDRAGKVVHIHPGVYNNRRQLLGDLATYLHVGFVGRGTTSK